MRIVFMGTPQFAATILEYVSSQHEVVAVYTRADAVRGRGKSLLPSDVKQMAQKLELPVYTPSTLRDLDVQEELASFEADVFCVAAYGMLLPKEVLDIPKYCCVNAHASILPRWRGAAPIERAILAGDEETGVSVMRMEEGLDTGDWCVQRSIEIGDKDAVTLTGDLALLGAQAMLTALAQIEMEQVRWNAQDDAAAVYANKIAKHELNMTPVDPWTASLRKVRASSVGHPSRCCIGGRGVTVLSAAVAEDDVDAAAGQVLLFNKKLYLGCADGPLQLCRVKPDGKKEMDATAFSAGLQGVKQGIVTWESIDAE